MYAPAGGTTPLRQDGKGTAQVSINSKKQTPMALTLERNGYAIGGEGENAVFSASGQTAAQIAAP